jgi:hypothetical protein
MEHSRFFDSVNGDRSYPASSFSEFFASIIGTGVQALGTNLQVLEVDGTMKVEIQPGVAWINGYFYTVDADKLQLTLDGTDATDNRFDRVVLQLDLVSRELTAKVLKGVADVNPVVPALTRTDTVYEISLAKIEVIAGKSYIEQNEIIDEREDDTVCGKAELLVMVVGFNPDDYGTADEVAANAQAILDLADAAFYDSNDKTISFEKQMITSSGGAALIDWRQGNKAEITLTEDVVLSFQNPVAEAGLTLIVKQDGIGGHVITFPNGIITPDEGAPAIAAAASAVTFYGLYFGGSEYLLSWSVGYGTPSSYVTTLE